MEVINTGTETITTDRLILRKIELSDAENLYKLLIDKDVLDFLAGIPEYTGVDMAVNYINNVLDKKYQEKDYYDWAIALKDTNELVGRIGPFKQDNDRRMVDLVWYIMKDHRGKGYTTEAAKAVINHFLNNGFERIEAFANVKNKSSKRVMEKVGMKYEGTLRKYDLTREGDLYDADMFSIIK